MTSNILRAAFGILAAAIIAAPHQGAVAQGEAFTPPRPPAMKADCAGVRGNGRNIFAHFGILARHVEEYGAVTCAAGGSSGSITVFMLESMWVNPSTHLCDGQRCDALSRDERLSLQLKAFVGLSDAGVIEDVATVAELIGAIQAQDIKALLEGPSPLDGVEALKRVLRDLGPLINQDVIALLTTSPDPVFHAQDIIEGLEKGVQFIVDDPRVFLRTSVLDFSEVAQLFGLYGSFFASYGPADVDGYDAWLDDCAPASRGLTWSETSGLSARNGETCGEALRRLFNDYRERVAAEGGRNRVDDKIGQFLPVFAVTGVIKGPSIDIWREARAAWLAAAPIPFEPFFGDIGVGYWGDAKELQKMAKELDKGFFDLGSSQFTPLGETSWAEALATSPAEPGFAPAFEIGAGVLSVGGWADPLRVLPLEALGAKATVSVNRLGGVGSFTIDTTRLLNASEREIDLLYSFLDPASTFYQSLTEATGVWCSDWDSQFSDPNLLFNDGYRSPLITEEKQFLRPRFGYDAVGPDFSIVGCTPGVVSPAARSQFGVK